MLAALNDIARTMPFPILGVDADNGTEFINDHLLGWCPGRQIRRAAKVSKKHDTATSPFHRATDHPTITVQRIVALTRTYSLIKPAATQGQVQALTAQLSTLTTSKAAPGATAAINKRARLREATNPPSRAS